LRREKREGRREKGEGRREKNSYPMKSSVTLNIVLMTTGIGNVFTKEDVTFNRPRSALERAIAFTLGSTPLKRMSWLAQGESNKKD